MSPTLNLSNMSMASQSIDSSMTGLQIFSVTIFAITASSSIIAYILVLLILGLYFKEFKSNFYYLVVSLAIADIGFLCLVLFYMIPCTILKKDVWKSTSYAPGLIEQISYFAECTHLTYIAINRLVYASVSGLNHPRLDKIFNNRYSVAFWIGFLWISAIAVPIMVQVAGCDLLYDQAYMALVYKCHPTITQEFADHVLLGDNFFAGFLPCLVTALHILTWCVVYYKGKQNGNSTEIVQQKKRERRLLIQFTLISLTLFFYYGSFWAIPYLFGSTSPYLIIITFFGILSTAVNPWTYLAFNKLMKAKAKHLIFNVLLKKKENNISPGPNGQCAISQQAKWVNEVSHG